jgi:hypothetical protein
MGISFPDNRSQSMQLQKLYATNLYSMLEKKDHEVSERVFSPDTAVRWFVVASTLNSEGIMVEQRAEEMTVILPEDVLRRPPGVHLTVSQRINLSQGDMFFHLGVWDPVSGRFGSIQTPLEVPKPGKSHVALGQD